MPPKKKNKNKTNGFYMYMLERKHEFEAQEGRNLSMSDLVPLAHPGWKAVPEDVKQQYNTRAKQYDKQKKADKPSEMSGKLDCTGLLVTERIDGQAQAKARRHAELQDLKSNWPEGNGVCMEKFFMISFESQCELKDGRFVPVELGVVEYSLCGGILNELQIFIDPGPIPMGFRYVCKAKSENTHNIPIEGFDQADKDYLRIFDTLCHFINPNGNRVFPPMYCELEKRPEIEGCLRWLCRETDIYQVFKIYEMEVLFCSLHKHADNVMPSYSQASDALRTSAFDYIGKTRCTFHEEVDTPMYYCALGRARKYCYVLSDSLGSVYEIIPSARHLPAAEDVPAFTFIPHSQFQNQSKGFRRPVTTEKYNDYRYDDYKDEEVRSRTDERHEYIPPAEPVVEHKPAQPMRRPATMGKSGQIAGSMAPIRALEMGAGRGAPIQNGLGRGVGRGIGRGAPTQTPGRREAPTQNPGTKGSPNGKFAMPANAAPPPSALPPPMAAWQGAGLPQGQPQDRVGATGDGEQNERKQLGATINDSLSSDLAAKIWPPLSRSLSGNAGLSSGGLSAGGLSAGIMPRGIGRGIGRGISKATLYNGL